MSFQIEIADQIASTTKENDPHPGSCHEQQRQRDVPKNFPRRGKKKKKGLASGFSTLDAENKGAISFKSSEK